MKSIYLIAFGFLLCLSSQAQKYDKNFKKLEKAFLQGDVREADDEFNDLREHFTGKYATFKDSVTAQYYEAKLYRLKGDFNYSEELSNRFVSRIRNRLGERSIDYLQILIDKATISLNSADFHSADVFLDEFFIKTAGVQLPDSEIIFKARALKTQTELERGNLANAGLLINNLINKAENRLLQRKEVVGKNGAKKYMEFKGEELIDRRRDLIRAKLLQARLLLLKGSYKDAEDSFAALQKLIKKYLKPQDQAYIEFQRAYGNFYAAIDQPKKAIAALKTALHSCGKRTYTVTYLKTHPVYLQICEELMQLYVAQKDFARAQDLNKEYRLIISQNYYETESFKVRLRIPFAISWEKKETSFIYLLEKIVKDIESYHLPNVYAYQILSHLYKTCIYGDSVKKAEGYIENYIRLMKSQYGEESIYYLYEQCEFANFYALYTDRVNKAEPLYNKYLHGALEKQLAPESNLLLDIQNKEGEYFEVKDQFQKAINNYIKVQQQLEMRFGKEDWRVAYQAMRVANVEVQMGEFPAAELKLKNSMTRLEKGRGKDSKEFIECLQKITRLYIITGRYEEAQKYLSRSIRTVKGASRTSLLTFNGLDEELMLLLYKGLYTEAQEKTQALIAYRLGRYGLPNHRSYITPYQIGAEVFLESGNYSTAQAMATKACGVSKAIFGDTSMQYLKSLALFCRVYAAFGDYERAQEAGVKSVEGIEKYFGNSHVEISKPKVDLAMILFYQGGDPAQVYELLTRSLEINKNKYGTDHPRYAEALQFLASFQISNKKYDEAKKMLDEADVIWVDKLGKTNTHSADILILRGEMDWQLGNYENCKHYFTKASHIYKEVFNETHPKYVAIMSRLGQTYYVMGDLNKALEICEITSEQNLNYVKKFFPSMSDREKSKSWSLIRPDFEFYYTLALKYKDKKPAVLGKMYDIVLNTKAILLSASIKVRERILASGDQELKNKFREWTRKKEEMTAAIELGPEERKLAGIDLRKLELESEQLEIELSKGSEEFKLANEERKINWKGIRDMLEKNEYATELIRFRYYDKGFTDSVIYAGLVVNPKTRSNPEMVVMNHGKSMETKYINYYRNCVKFLLKDTLSFNVFWKPLKALYATGAKIYLSPDGVYNELNIESLLGPNGKYVIEEENIDLICNSKDIFSAKNLVAKSSESRNTAFLLGDPQFYSTTHTETQVESEMIAQLPGTKEEVKEIGDILKSNRWETKSYTGKEANEDVLKGVRNPRILHVATHGYFLENLQDDNESTSFSMINQNKAVDNPLLRSGLYLNNAGDIVDKGGEEAANEQIGEGVLTAYEAMNLNLNATDLVVLSACETGRGEIQVGEGVYGLQRAFQIAGAKAVIMSLFKVSDQATQELMNIFYANWIGNGMDMRKAFIEAKKAMLKKRPQPLYWGSFVMVGVG